MLFGRDSHTHIQAGAGRWRIVAVGARSGSSWHYSGEGGIAVTGSTCFSNLFIDIVVAQAPVAR